MLIPIRHENMRGRRWPVITFALIALNVLAFLGTHWTIDSQNPERAEVRTHILLLAAMHPELQVPPAAREFVSNFAEQNPGAWKQIAEPNREILDAWDAKVRLMEDPAELQAEMDTLGDRFQREEQSSIVERYAFVPAHPHPSAYLTANFLHGGWLHLIGNMWFLWLAGFILEDTWGRVIYSVFYLVAGAAALQFHAWIYPHSSAPALGASGAVAALMGAFLVRYPKMKIEMMWILGLFRTYRFKAYAYWLLPLWLLVEIFSGSLFGQASGVAHWAHVGGFLFGVVAALGIKHSGLETKANQVIEDKLTWTADPEILQATEFLEQGKLDDAGVVLERYLSVKPDSPDGLTLLQQVHWRKGGMESFREVTTKLCQLHLNRQDREAALHDYDEFVNAGGEKLPASTWLELCRAFETGQHFDRAVTEYDKLSKAYPAERQGLLALLAGGRLCLKKLNRPADALRFYQEAVVSPVPHLDWEANIHQGIQEAKSLLSGSQTGIPKKY